MFFDPPTIADEQATMRDILSHIPPKDAETVKMVFAGLKTHLGDKFYELGLEWATPYGRYKAKGLWAKVRPDPDAMTEVIERHFAAKNLKPRFVPTTAAELTAKPPLPWRIKSVLPTQGVAVVFGPSGSGKSFLALHIAATIAEGSAFFGHVATSASVLYIGLEGEAGYRGRVIAWQNHHCKAMPEGVRYLLKPFRLTNAQDVADIAAICPPGCVVFIDTLNRAAPGMDENNSRDMGAVIEGAKNLQGLVGGLVVLIAHTGKDTTKGLRGHSSLFAALDAAIQVSRDGDSRSWRLDKAKDGKDGEEHRFKLDVVAIGADEDGDLVTSCVVVPDMSAPVASRQKVFNASQKLAWDTFSEAMRTKCETDAQGEAIGVHLNDWRPMFYQSSAASNEGAKEKSFERARKWLVETGWLSVNNYHYLPGGPFPQLTASVARAAGPSRQADRQPTLADMSGSTPSLFADRHRHHPLGVSGVGSGVGEKDRRT